VTVELTNSFEVPVPEDVAFATLIDVARVIPCFPGAELIDVVDATTYRCKVTMRLGPISLTFRGTAKVLDVDAAGKNARIELHASDEKGRGGADALVQFQLENQDAATKVDVHTTVTLTGTIAQYGRAAGIIQGVASDLTRRFAAGLKTMLAA
jgi:carbon monoxide dehydrogenase subunit G